MTDETNALLVPPKALLSRNPLQWIRYFGPGAILASVTIGSGELVFPSRGGAMFGYNLLWIFFWGGLLKWCLCYSSMRHMILSGGHPMQRWSFLPGPRGWLPLMLVIISVMCLPLFYAWTNALMGEVCAWIFGWFDKYVWATLACAVVIVLLATGGYSFMEKAQMVILAIMVVCTLIAAVYVRPDWLVVLKNTFIPQGLHYDDWVLETIPQLKNRTPWVETLVYVSVIGGVTYDYLAYLSFLREKKWGNCHRGIISDSEQEEMVRQPQHAARLWLRAALVDTVASFFMVILVAICFAVLGTMVLRPEQLIPDGMNLLQNQAKFLEILSPMLVPLYKVAVFLAFFGITYSAPELAYRAFYEYVNSLGRAGNPVQMKKMRWAIIFWCLGGGMVVLWLSKLFPTINPLDIVTPAGLIVGVWFCGIYCLANPWMDRRFLLPELRMGWLLEGLNYVAGAIFLAVGFKGMWDYRSSGVFSLVVLLVIIAVAMLLAKALRPWMK